MAAVNEIYGFLDTIAPFALQMDFDNAGFLVGRGEAQADTVLVALDITREVILEGEELGAQLIVSHHPVIFRPVKSLTDRDPVGERLLMLAERRMAAICAHTNLDTVQGGVNDLLAQAVGLESIEQLHQDGLDPLGRPYGVGRVGELPRPMAVRAFAGEVKRVLGAQSVRFVDAGRPVRRVAVGGGACGDMLPDALERGCDTFLTSDVKYDVFLQARALGVNLLDAGHFATENVVCVPLAERLRRQFPELRVEVSSVHHEAYQGL